MIEKGYEEFAKRWIPILDEFQKLGVRFALEVHPTEIAFDIHTAHLALQAVDNHPAFGLIMIPAHLGYQHVDYVRFIYEFDRIFHVHRKMSYWAMCQQKLESTVAMRSSAIIADIELPKPWPGKN